MKTLVILAGLSIVLNVQSCAQTSNSEQVPEAVKSAFNEKFPNAKKIKWEMENDSEWEGEFKMSGKEYAAVFTASGEWIETEQEIKKSEVPASVITILDQHFTDYEVEEAEIVETPSGNAYEFEIEVGEEEYEVRIDAQGNLSKKIEQEDNQDDDEN